MRVSIPPRDTPKAMGSKSFRGEMLLDLPIASMMGRRQAAVPVLLRKADMMPPAIMT